jgi:NADPH2:quinone reductase
MRAIVCSRFGGPEVLEITEIDEPVVGSGQVLIDVHACAVNFPDLLMIQDLYQFKPGLPFVPGSEVSGVIREVGDGVTGLSIGDRIIGSAAAGTGGLADRAALRADSVIPVPDGVPLPEAPGLMYAYGTSFHALRDRARLQPGETLLVLGASGATGLSAIELGHVMGARVIAAASTEEKLAVCRKHGADETVNYDTEDLKTRVRELTGGAGADVVYDPVGGSYSEPALRATAWDGRYLVIGFTAGDIPRIPLNLPLLRECSIVGVFFGAFVARFPERNQANKKELAGWWREGKLKPYTSAVFPLERASDALRELAERRATGKVVVAVV